LLRFTANRRVHLIGMEACEGAHFRKRRLSSTRRAHRGLSVPRPQGKGPPRCRRPPGMRPPGRAPICLCPRSKC
jgi:hypothetical protein